MLSVTSSNLEPPSFSRPITIIRTVGCSISPLKRLLLALVCLLLPACSGKPKPPAPCSLNVAVSPLCAQESVPEMVSPKITVHFFVDATESMKGYLLKSAGSSAYQELLRTLEDAVADFNQFDSKAWKFGNSIPLPIDRRLHIAAGSDPTFYRAVGDYTQIEMLLKETYAPINTNQLTVIVTDLYQKDTDVTGLTNKLKSGYFSKGLAVGVIGIESPFEGIVYDLDSRESKKSIKANRPVYALVIGTYANIAHYFDALKQRNSTLNQKAQFVIFTGRPFKQRSDFFVRNPTLAESKGGGLTRIGKLSDGRTYLFRLQGKAPETVAFSVCPTAAFLPYVLPFSNQGTWQKQVQVLATKEFQSLNQPQAMSVEADDKACQSDQLKDTLSYTKGLGFKVTIMTDTLKQGSDTLFTSTYTPTLTRDPDWWEAWNTDSGVDQPTRTLLLKQFLRSLEADALSSNTSQPVAMQFYVQN